MRINWLTILSFVGILNSTAASASVVTSNEINASQIEKSDILLHGTARETLLESIIYLVADVLGIDSSIITAESTFEELKADSLSMYEISVQCGKTYNVKISGQELSKLTNVQSLCDLVHSKIVEDSRRPQK
mgnify:FL=1